MTRNSQQGKGSIGKIVHSLQNAVTLTDDDEWIYIIDETSVNSAKVVLDYLIEEKIFTYAS